MSWGELGARLGLLLSCGALLSQLPTLRQVSMRMGRVTEGNLAERVCGRPSMGHPCCGRLVVPGGGYVPLSLMKSEHREGPQLAHGYMAGDWYSWNSNLVLGSLFVAPCSGPWVRG